ncbi:2S seed storage albumin protein-like [Nymphaea colorata]|nr:2S seed storage albumin protein-like [Nymphaea colorata]
MACSFSTNYVTPMTALWLVWLLAAVAEASIFRTMQTTETVTVDDDLVEYGREWPGSLMCRMEQMDLDDCKSYVEHGRDGVPLLGFRSGGSRERPPRQCCQQLKVTRQDCRCEAIRQLVSGGSQRGEDVEGRVADEWMMKRAENLPKTCGLSRHHCSIHQVGIRSTF